MSTKKATGRLSELVACGADAFIAAKGYRLTQISDVARRMGVSQGTIYNYVESKEALFDLCVRCLNEPDQVRQYDVFPVPTPERGSLVQYLADWMKDRTQPSAELEQAVASSSDPTFAELQRIVRELYLVIYEKRWVVKLIESCSSDFKELSATWFRLGREEILLQLGKYLDRGISGGHFPNVGDSSLAARQMLEIIAYWAIHIHWDPSPISYDENTIEDMVVTFCTSPFKK